MRQIQRLCTCIHSHSYTDHASISASTIQLMDPARSDLGFCEDKQNEEAERLLLYWGGQNENVFLSMQ